MVVAVVLVLLARLQQQMVERAALVLPAALLVLHLQRLTRLGLSRLLAVEVVAPVVRLAVRVARAVAALEERLPVQPLLRER